MCFVQIERVCNLPVVSSDSNVLLHCCAAALLHVQRCHSPLLSLCLLGLLLLLIHHRQSPAGNRQRQSSAAAPLLRFLHIPELRLPPSGHTVSKCLFLMSQIIKFL